MARSSCCKKIGLRKGPWTAEEDQKLLTYIEEHGRGGWKALPTKAGNKMLRALYFESLCRVEFQLHVG